MLQVLKLFFILLADSATTNLQPKPNAETKNRRHRKLCWLLLCIGGFRQQQQ